MFIRKDLPLADQMVQVGHVCQEAGKTFSIPTDCHMVLIGLDNSTCLENTILHLNSLGIDYCNFYEPDSAVVESDIPMGVTALCTTPISKEQRKYLTRYKLWKPI